MTHHPGVNPSRVRPAPQQQQRGVVLVLALILLTVVSLVGIYTLRGALTGEQISKNLRTNALAMQAAETALRICEDALRTEQGKLGTGTEEVDFTVRDVPLEGSEDLPTHWSKRENWVLTDSGKTANLIPASLMNDAAMRPLPPSRCMAEHFQLPIMGEDKTMSQPVLVTAIGYTPDYQVDANGKGIAGGEVWLQSVLRP